MQPNPLNPLVHVKSGPFKSHFKSSPWSVFNKSLWHHCIPGSLWLKMLSSHLDGLCAIRHLQKLWSCIFFLQIHSSHSGVIGVKWNCILKRIHGYTQISDLFVGLDQCKLRPGDAIWRQWPGSTSAQVLACYRTAPVGWELGVGLQVIIINPCRAEFI